MNYKEIFRAVKSAQKNMVEAINHNCRITDAYRLRDKIVVSFRKETTKKTFRLEASSKDSYIVEVFLDLGIEGVRQYLYPQQLFDLFTALSPTTRSIIERLVEGEENMVVGYSPMNQSEAPYYEFLRKQQEKKDSSIKSSDDSIIEEADDGKLYEE